MTQKNEENDLVKVKVAIKEPDVIRTPVRSLIIRVDYIDTKASLCVIDSDGQ